MNRNQAAATFLGSPVAQLYYGCNHTIRIEQHVPGQFSDFTGTQACLQRKENNESIANWMSCRSGKDEEIFVGVLG